MMADSPSPMDVETPETTSEAEGSSLTIEAGNQSAEFAEIAMDATLNGRQSPGIAVNALVMEYGEREINLKEWRGFGRRSSRNYKLHKEQAKELEKNLIESCDKLKDNFVLPSKTKLNIELNHVTLTAKWKWLDKDDTCGICRSPYEACCSSCKMPGDECPLGIAECRHAFHIHCILKWVQQQSKSNCPLCRFEWKNPPAPIFNLGPEEIARPPVRQRIPSDGTTSIEINQSGLKYEEMLPTVLPSKTKLNIKINHVTLTAKWKWLDKDDTCGICRSPYEACCSSCKMPGDECPLAIAECRHCFHDHCILKWFREQSKANCPLCRFEWKNPPALIFNLTPEEISKPTTRQRIPSEVIEVIQSE